MRNFHSRFAVFFASLAMLITAESFAQSSAPVIADKKVDAQTQPALVANTPDNTQISGTDKATPAKKMVQDASISLQTTVTGNQEQPRVLYILPWQSPMAGNVDFESLDNEQKAVFGHIEREELRRELESSDEKK
ncbi:MAG: hypothetical protein EOO53_04915 [Gammaproteobacteria bacterium]|nr:MAG: hypothetical protein EOO53_04915 [Gammaproteobacteria bacterium]